MAGVWSSQKKEGSPQTIPGIKDNLQERVSTQSVVEKENGNLNKDCPKVGNLTSGQSLEWLFSR